MPLSSLWQPFTLGRVELSHRLALAPMTRNRADADGTPGDLVAEYYAQRASLGLLITEGVQPAADGQGYLNTPESIPPSTLPDGGTSPTPCMLLADPCSSS